MQGVLQPKFSGFHWGRSPVVLLLVVLLGAADVGAQDGQDPLRAAFEALAGYQWGPGRDALAPIDLAARECHGDPEIRKSLEDRLIGVLESDATLAAKSYVCETLAVMGTSRSVSAVAGLLGKADLAHGARQVLEAVSGPEATEALRKAVPDLAGDLKIGVIASLGRCGDAESVPILEGLLENEDSKVVRAALVALGRIDSPEARKAVIEFYPGAGTETRLTCVDACLRAAETVLAEGRGEEAGEIYRGLQESVRPQVRMAAFRGLVLAEPEDAEDRLLLALSEDDHRFRLLAARLIGETMDERDIERLAGSVSDLPVEGRIALLEVLGQRDGPFVRRAALEGLRSGHGELRAAAATALGVSGEAEDVRELARLAAEAKEEGERRAATESLRRMPGRDVDEAILAAVDAVSADEQVLLIEAMAKRGSPGALPVLLEKARAEDGSVRVAAFRALQSVAGPARRDVLVKLLAQTSPGEEREAADRALWRSCLRVEDVERRADPVLAALEDATIDERCAILPALGRIGGKRALEAVRSALADANPQVRSAGVRALANWPTVDAADELWQIATEDAVASHRIWALRGFVRVVPQLAEEGPEVAFRRLARAMEVAQRLDEKKLILSRVTAVRVAGSLQMAISCLEDPALGADAIEAVVSLAEGMKETHPKEARAALERVAPIVDNPDLGVHIAKILWNMELKGN